MYLFFAISTNKQTREGVKKLKLTKLKTCPQLTNKLILAIAEYCLANWKYKRNNIHSLQRKKAICTNTLQQQWTQPKSICKSQNPIKYQQILKGPLGFLSRPIIQITSNQIMFFKRKEHFFLYGTGLACQEKRSHVWYSKYSIQLFLHQPLLHIIRWSLFANYQGSEKSLTVPLLSWGLYKYTE